MKSQNSVSTYVKFLDFHKISIQIEKNLRNSTFNGKTCYLLTKTMLLKRFNNVEMILRAPSIRTQNTLLLFENETFLLLIFLTEIFTIAH